MRSERFSNEREIERALKNYVSGPVVGFKSGKYLVDDSERSCSYYRRKPEQVKLGEKSLQ